MLVCTFVLCSQTSPLHLKPYKIDYDLKEQHNVHPMKCTLTQFHSRTESNISVVISIPPKLRSMNLASCNLRPLLYSRFIYPQYQDSDLVIIQTLDPGSYLRWPYMTTKTWYIPIIPLDQPTTLLRHLCINSPFKLRRGLGFVPTSHFSLSVEKIYYNFLQQYYCTCTTHSIPLIVLILFTYYILVLFFVYMPATLCSTKFGICQLFGDKAFPNMSSLA